MRYQQRKLKVFTLLVGNFPQIHDPSVNKGRYLPENTTSDNMLTMDKYGPEGVFKQKPTVLPLGRDDKAMPSLQSAG